MTEESDKPPDIITVEQFLEHLVAEGEVTDAVVRITINQRTWKATRPVVHQHLLISGQVVKRDFDVAPEVFSEACDRGFLVGKSKGQIVSCTERVISNRGYAHIRYRTTVPAK